MPNRDGLDLEWFAKKFPDWPGQQILDLGRSLVAFMQPDDWAEAIDVVRHHPVLLSDPALQLLSRAARKARGEPARFLRTSAKVLKECRRVGPDEALAQYRYARVVQPIMRELGEPAGPGGETARVELCRTALASMARHVNPEAWALLHHELARNILLGLESTAEHVSEAIASQRAALEIYTREADEPMWVTTMRHLGVAYRIHPAGNRIQNLEAAIEHHTEILEAGTASDRAETMEELGRDYTRLVEARLAMCVDNAAAFIDVIEASERAVRIVDPKLLPDRVQAFGWLRDPKGWSALTQWASHMLGRAEYRDALVLEFPVEWAETLAEPPLRRIAEANNLLGIAYRRLGQYESAAASYENGLRALMRAGSEHDEMMVVLVNNAAESYRLMGQHRKALLFAGDARRLAREAKGEESDAYATALYTQAKVYSDLDLKAEALEISERELALTEKLSEPQSAALAESLGLAGELQLAVGNYDRAGELLERCRAIVRSQGRENQPENAMLHYNCGRLRLIAGDYAAAERDFLMARRLAAADSGSRGARHLSLHALAFLCARTGRAAEALALTCEAIELENDGLWRILSVSTDTQRRSQIERLTLTTNILLSLVRQFFAGDRSAVATALAVVLNRKALATEAFAATRAFAGSGDGDTQVKLDALRLFQRSIAQRIFAGVGTVDESMLADLKIEAEEGSLIAHMASADVWREMETVTVEDAAAGLEPDTALVEIVLHASYNFDEDLTSQPRERKNWQPPRYLAFVLHPGAAPYVELLDLGDASHINAMIDEHVSQFVGGGRHLSPEPDEAAGSDRGRALSEALFEPIVHALRGKERLFIAPDGNVALLPFGALAYGDGYLVDRFDIRYLTSGRDLIRLRARAPSREGIAPPLVVSAPDFDLATGPAAPRVEKTAGVGSGLRFHRLDGAAAEGRDVARLLGAECLTGDAATARAIKSVRAPSVLHLATHGCFLPPPDPDDADRPGAVIGPFARLTGHRDNPLLRSLLALAGANSFLHGKPLPPDAETGILTAQDVVGLDLDGTQLVVLSACESGVGQIAPGEGVLGLRRAFIMAGARNVVLSLWKVADDGTHQLMRRFYEHIVADGLPCHEALRRAQLELRAAFPADPSVWGAFICQGIGEAYQSPQAWK
jgi:CHAT domain-containing protein/tetratricopeptide (TPR) repeat protein